MLIADDDPAWRERVRGTLEGAGFQVVEASDGASAVERFHADAPDVAVLDIEMPRLTGLDVLRVLKAQADRFVPVILLTSRAELESRVGGLRMGADDYLTKPFAPAELVARVEAMLRIKRRHDDAQRVRAEAEQASRTDPLTGLGNRRALDARLDEEVQRAERYHEPLALMIVDLDRFKEANDRFGHPFGDRVLCAVADILRRDVRSIDAVFRQGGDEFVVILPNTHFTGALTVARRVLCDVAACALSEEDRTFATTCSIGVSLYPSPSGTGGVPDLVRRADQALYRAKEEGRNRICMEQAQRYVYVPERT